MKMILRRAYNVFLNRIIKIKMKKIHILSSDDTVEYIINNNISVCRFGDGEMFIIDKESGCGFQDVNDDLSERLYNVLNDINNDRILICIPKWMFDKKELKARTIKSQKWCKKYLINHYKTWCKKINLDYLYGDTSFNRRYIASADKSNSYNIFKSLKKIWDGRDICFVEGEKTRLGVGNDLFDNANSIKRILAPAENAFSKLERIENECKKLPYNTLFLVALGPTATILCHDLANLGFQAIDIGHIDVEYEWFLMGATDVIPIKNKYVNEANNKTYNCNFQDKKYDSQIIGKIL